MPFYDALLDELAINNGAGDADELRAVATKIISDGQAIDDRELALIIGELRGSDDVAIADDAKDRLLTVSNSLLRRVLLLGTAQSITDTALHVLSTVAARREAGITQADLARELSMDPRTLFHHLKPLVANRLIVKIPVSANRSFTNLLKLARFADEKGDNSGGTAAKGSSQSGVSPITVSTVEIRQRVVRMLAEHDSMLSRRMFEELQLDRSMVKSYRRAVLWLLAEGVLESIGSRELGGAEDGRVYRLVKPLDAALAIAVKKPAKQEDKPSRQPAIRVSEDMPAEQKVRTAIHACGATGVTVAELAEQLALDREVVYKIQDRLSVDIRDMEDKPERPLLRTIEFFGRQRRLRLFTRATWAARVAEGDKDVAVLSSPSGLSARSSATSLTLASRQEAIQRLLRDSPILEIGRPLADRIQRELSLPHTLDTKTIKRTAGLMEAAGLVHRLDIVTGRGAQFNRSIIHRLGDSDPQLLAYIKRVKEGSIAEEKPVLPSQGLSSISFTRSMFAGDQLGMVNGVMARARILHEHLWDSFEAFDTLEALFRQLPFGLYRRLIGLAGTPLNARGKPEPLPPPQTPLEALPDIWRQTVNTRSSRHRYIVRLLLGILEAIGALKACHDTIYGLDEQSLTAWRLGPDALQYAGLLVGANGGKFRYLNSPRLPPSFVVQRSFAISGQALATPALLWELLESRQADGLAAEQDSEWTPEEIVLALARSPACWSRKRDVQRSLRHALRRAILDEHSKKTITQREFVPIGVWRLDSILPDRVLADMAAEHGVDPELCRRTLDEMKQAHLAREAHRRAASLAGTSSSGAATPAHNHDDEEATGEQLHVDLAWTDELNELLLLGYHLLATDRRFWIAHRRAINWSLLDPILFPDAPARMRTHRMESVRRHVTYLTRSIRWRKRYYVIANSVAATGTIDSVDLGEHIRHHRVLTRDWRGVKSVRYAALSPLEKCSKETHRRCIEEIHPILSDPPYVEWPEEMEALLSRLLRALVHDSIDGRQDKAARQLLASSTADSVLEWMKSAKLLTEHRKGDRKLAALPGFSAGPALEWILDANASRPDSVVADLTASWPSATDEQFGRLITLVSRSQVTMHVDESSGDFGFVDARPGLSLLGAFVCPSRHSILCHDDGSLDAEMLQRIVSVVQHRFERDYALSVMNLSLLSPVLRRAEVEAILGLLVDQQLVRPAVSSNGTLFYHLSLFDLQ